MDALHGSTKCIEKKLDSNCTRMLSVILNKSWKQHPSKQQLYGYLPPISKTIQIKQTRHCALLAKSTAGGVRTNSEVTFSNRHAGDSWPIRTYQQQLYMDTKCSLEDLLEVMDDSDEWQERVWEIRSSSTSWWWWWWWWCPNSLTTMSQSSTLATAQWKQTPIRKIATNINVIYNSWLSQYNNNNNNNKIKGKKKNISKFLWILNSEKLWYIFFSKPLCISIAVSLFARGSGDLGSIPAWVIPKTQKMVLEASMIHTQHYKVHIKGKVEQSRERSNPLLYTSVQ